MRPVEEQPDDAVAEMVEPVAAPGGLRHRDDARGEHRLVRQFARGQVQHVARKIDGLAVAVGGGVADAVFHAVACCVGTAPSQPSACAAGSSAK